MQGIRGLSPARKSTYSTYPHRQTSARRSAQRTPICARRAARIVRSIYAANMGDRRTRVAALQTQPDADHCFDGFSHGSAVLLGYAFGGAVKNLKLGIVDQDGHLACCI